MFPKRQLPKGVFKSGNFPTVQFPKSVIVAWEIAPRKLVLWNILYYCRPWETAFYENTKDLKYK